MFLILVVLFLVVCASSEASARKPPNPHCGRTVAPLLCSLHWQRATANWWRARMSLKPYGYAHQGEMYPKRRPSLLLFWRAKRIAAKRQYELWSKAPWLHGAVYEALMCIHHGPDGQSGEGAWTAYNPDGPYYGGLQADRSFYTTYGAPEVLKYGGRDPRYWTPADQLHMGYRGVMARGYGPWPLTARRCGLL